jgi:hypothetical protein
MGQQQGQYFGLVNELSTEAGLQLRGSEQKLLTARQIFSSDYSILLLLSASTLDSLVLAAHLVKDSQKVTMRLFLIPCG